MSFWNPEKVGEDRQLELDRRVIVKLGMEKLLAQKSKVELRLEKQRDKLSKSDYSNTTQRTLTKLRNDYTFTIKELNSINRRIEMCEDYLK